MTTDATEFRKQIDAIKSEALEPTPAPQPEPEVESEVQVEVNEEVVQPVQETEEQEVQEEAESEESTEVLEKGLVPRGRLNKEIKKAKDVEAALAKEREERQRDREELLLTKQRMQQLEQAFKSMQPSDKPDPDIDPEGYEQYQKEQEKKEFQTKLKEFEDFKKQSEQQHAVQQITQAVAQDIKGKMSEKPDVVDAYNHLVDAKRKEFALLSRNMEELNARVDQYLLSYAVPCLQKGLSPADIFYQLAQTAGYKAKKAAGSSPSIEAIEANKKKVASSTPEKAKSDAGFAGGNISVKDALNKNGRGVDPEAFKKVLQNIKG